MPSLRFLLLLPLVLAAVLLPGSARSASTAANDLTATVGPGFSIKLADSSGQGVIRLPAGAYTITVVNKSQGTDYVHNFHLKGPGVDMASDFSPGTTTWNVTLVDGTYNFKCDAHPLQMKGSFQVGNAPPPTPKLTGKVGPTKTISLKKGSSAVKTLKAGSYKLAVSDLSKVDNFHLSGPGVNKKTGVKFKGSSAWTVRLRAGTYTFRSDATKKLRRTFKVTS